MNRDLFSFLEGALVAVILTFYFMKKEIIEVEVPVLIEVPVPVVEKVFKTVREPYAVKGDTVIDSIYYDRYIALKDSVARDSLYKEAITIRTYNEKVEDNILTISLEATVRGELLDYKLGYKTKPRTVTLDTVIKVAIPMKPSIYGGAYIYLPPSNSIIQPSIIPTIMYKNRKSTIIYSIGYDVVNKGYIAGAFIRF